MFTFKRIELSDRDPFEDCIRQTDYRTTEMSFTVLYIWRDKYKCEICFKDGFLFIRYKDRGGNKYMYPIGPGDAREALMELAAFCGEQEEEFSLHYLTEEMKDSLEKLLPGCFEYEEQRDSADYLYETEKMITLGGKKLHSKRNYINRFKTEYEGRWSFAPLTDEDIPDINKYEKHWQRDNRTSEGDLHAENIAIKMLLENMEELGAVGGVLRLDGEIIGFSVGAAIAEDTFDIQIEKAEWEIPGAYQVLNQEFAAMYCGGYAFINREDDMGIEGLRKAKLSYYPDKLLMKYSASCKSGERYLCVMHMNMHNLERGYHEVSSCTGQ